VSELDSLLASLHRRKPERLEKDAEIYKIMARVFDSSTLLTLYRMMNRGVFEFLHGAVSTGKEANVFCASDEIGNFVAIKIYRIATTDFKTMYRYLAGDPRYARVPNERRRIIFAWTSREFKNLQRAHEAGVPVPRPIDCEKNVLAMEFLGEGGVPYPRMKDAEPDDPEQAYRILLDALTKLYRDAGIVHSDFSEYNVLLTPDPVLIDFSMGTELGNPMAREYLRRDLANLVRYFRRLGVDVPEVRDLEKTIVQE
jgi:RIO kinase 1